MKMMRDRCHSSRLNLVLAFFCLHFSIAVVMNAQEDTTSGAPALASDIDADEHVIFFPTCAHLDETGGSWNIPIHGIVYEPEKSSLTRKAMVFGISELLGVKSGTTEAGNLNRRLRLFLVDNERGQRVSVRIGSTVYPLEPSGANGHFQTRVQIAVAEFDSLFQHGPLDGTFIEFSAVTREGDERRLAGRAQLVRPTGLSIISDIDDTIKHSQVGNHRAVLANTFLHRFKPLPGMPELYAACARRGISFHYVSGSPWQLYLPLAEFLADEGFPAGSFDLKHFRLKDKSAVGLLRSHEASKRAAIDRFMADFPGRKFILIGDSGEQDPEIYTRAALAYPTQIAAIFIRNVTGESIENRRFGDLRERLGDKPCLLFDEPSRLQPHIEALQAARGD